MMQNATVTLSDWQREVLALLDEVLQERKLRARDIIRDLEEARGFAETFEETFLNIASDTAQTLNGQLKVEMQSNAPEPDGRLMGLHWNRPDKAGIWVWFDDESRKPQVKWTLGNGPPHARADWETIPEDTHPEVWVKDRIRELIRAALTF